MSLVGRPHARTPIILLISLVNVGCLQSQLCGVMGSKARAILIELIISMIYNINEH